MKIAKICYIFKPKGEFLLEFSIEYIVTIVSMMKVRSKSKLGPQQTLMVGQIRRWRGQSQSVWHHFRRHQRHLKEYLVPSSLIEDDGFNDVTMNSYSALNGNWTHCQVTFCCFNITHSYWVNSIELWVNSLLTATTYVYFVVFQLQLEYRNSLEHRKIRLRQFFPVFGSGSV